MTESASTPEQGNLSQKTEDRLSDDRANGPHSPADAKSRAETPRIASQSDRAPGRPPAFPNCDTRACAAQGGGKTTQPPSPNRGVTNPHIDWLTIQVYGSTDRILTVLFSVLYEQKLAPDMRPSSCLTESLGHRFYHHRYPAPLQTFIHVGPRFDSEEHISVQLTSTTFDLIPDPAKRLISFIAALKDEDMPYSVTRCDFAFDHGHISPLDAMALFDSGQLNTRARTKEWRSSRAGDTFYIGARKSEKYVRVYNYRGFNRIELEMKKETASQIFHEWLNDPYAPDEALASFCTFPGIELTRTEFTGIPEDFEDREKNELSEFCRTIDRLGIQLLIAKEVFGGFLDEWFEKKYYV